MSSKDFIPMKEKMTFEPRGACRDTCPLASAIAPSFVPWMRTLAPGRGTPVSSTIVTRIAT